MKLSEPGKHFATPRWSLPTQNATETTRERESDLRPEDWGSTTGEHIRRSPVPTQSAKAKAQAFVAALVAGELADA